MNAIRSAARPLSAPPEATRQFTDFLASLGTLTGTSVELRRGLATAERTTLRTRELELARFLTRPTSREIRDTIARCFAGFSFAATPQEAQAIGAQYVVVLQDCPLWAIEKACMRFARGEVKPEEVGAKQPLDLREKPTTAQLHTVVEAIVHPFAAEARRIYLTLRAEAPRPPITEEVRARTNKAIEEWRNDAGVRLRQDFEAEREKRRKSAMESDESHRKMVLQQYEMAGLPPPEERPGKALVSLPLLLSLGWRIETGPDRKPVLVAPPPPPEAPPPDHRAEESHQRMLAGLKRMSVGARAANVVR